VAQEKKGNEGVVTVAVRRASTTQEYSVPIEGTKYLAASNGAN
jgi:hypothetical protein